MLRTRAAPAWMERCDYLPTARRRGDEQHHGQALYRSLDGTPIKNTGAGAAMMRIEAARRVFPRCWFNESTTEGGRDALGYYHERQDEKRSIGLGPEHDWSSRAADAFGYMAISYEEPTVKNASRSNRRSAELLRGTHWSM